MLFSYCRTPVKRRRGRPCKVPKTPSPPVLEPQTSPEFPKTKETPSSKDHESDKEEEEEEEETPPRRITRRLSCSTLNSAPQTETRLRQRSESGPKSTRKTRSESVTSDSSGGHPTPRPGLRHSARLSSHGSTSAPPEITREIALPSRERKKSDPDVVFKPQHKEKHDKQDKHDSKAGGHKDKVTHHKGSEDNKENVKHGNLDQSKMTESSDKSSFSCKLLTAGANYNGRTPPVKIYGAQHLLRMFGKNYVLKIMTRIDKGK